MKLPWRERMLKTGRCSNCGKKRAKHSRRYCLACLHKLNVRVQRHSGQLIQRRLDNEYNLALEKCAFYLEIKSNGNEPELDEHAKFFRSLKRTKSNLERPSSQLGSREK